VLAESAADTRPIPGGKAACDIDFAGFHISPLVESPVASFGRSGEMTPRRNRVRPSFPPSLRMLPKRTRPSGPQVVTA